MGFRSFLPGKQKRAARMQGRRPPRPLRFRPRLEQLEDRCTPAAVTWTGAINANWSNPFNWQGNVVPTPFDVATFDGSVSNASATIDIPFNIAGLNVLASYAGTVTDPSTLTVGTAGFRLSAGTFQVTNGATINDAGDWNVIGSINPIPSPFIPGTGTVVFNGSTVQTLASSVSSQGFPPRPDFNNLTINNPPGGSVVVNGTGLLVQSNVLLEAGSFAMGNSSSLELNGNITNNADPADFVAPAAVIFGTPINNLMANSVVGGTSATIFNDVTIYSGSVRLATDITVKNLDVGVLGVGTVDGGSNTLTVLGDFSVTASGTFIPSTGTVVFVGTTAQTLGGKDIPSQPVPPVDFHFNNLRVQNGTGGSVGVRNLDSVTVAGAFQVQSGAFAIPANTLTLDGSFSVSPGAKFSPGTGTVVFAGATAQTVQTSAATGFNNLTINNAPGGSVTLVPGPDLTVGANFLLQAGSFTDSSTTLIVSGNFTNNAGPAAFAPGTGTVVFGGSATQTLGGSFGTTFNNLTVNQGGGGVVQLGASAGPTVTGNFLLDAGSFATGAATVTVDGNFTNDASATAFNAGTGTVVLAGAGAQTVGGSANTTFNNLTINNAPGGIVTLAAGLTLTGDFTLAAGSFTLGADTLTIQGNFFNNAGATAFNGAGGSVVFAGSRLQSLGGTAPTTFDQLAYSAALTLRLLTTPTTANTVVVGDTGTIDLNGTTLVAGRVVGNGTIAQSTGPGRLVVNGPNDSTLSATLTGTVGLTKAGPATLTVLASNSTTGTTVVAAGTLLVNGLLAQSSVTVNGSAFLRGSGTVGSVSVAGGGTLKPGVNAGTLTSTGDITFSVQSTFLVDVDAYLPTGSQFDQLVLVNGVIQVDGAVLTVNLKPGVTPPLGAQFTVVSNPGGQPVRGTFAGLPEGATLSLGGMAFQITYAGGAGRHDVVLTRGVRVTLTLVPSPPSAPPGQPITFTATVTSTGPGVGPPSGTLVFAEGAVVLQTSSLTNGQATFTTAALPAGSHTLTAGYDGDTVFIGITSAPATISVGSTPAVAGHRSTVAVYDLSTATWYLRNDNSAGGPNFPPFAFGAPGLLPLAGDYIIPDGREGIALYDPATGVWVLTDDGQAFPAFQFGPGGLPVTIDLNGDGKDGIALYNNGAWTIGDDTVVSFGFGVPGMIPVAGDFDGDGRDGVGLFNPFDGTWYLTDGGKYVAFGLQFGVAFWKPVVGDWDGSGKDSIGVFDPSTGAWFLRDSIAPGNVGFKQFAYGAPGWLPVVGDWDGPGGQAELAAALPPPGSPPAGVLAAADLLRVRDAALARFAAAGLDAVNLDRLRAVSVVLADLPRRELGLQAGQTIYLDADAAGYGWFADPTLLQDEEFAGTGPLSAGAGSPAAGRMDLLTVLEHEYGHVLGLPDVDAAGHPDDLMADVLAPGERRLFAVDSLFVDDHH